MFTGIIDHFGTIENIQDLNSGKRLTVKSDFDDLDIGESVAVNGACMTVVSISGANFDIDVSPESLNLTTLCHANLGDAVNLERSLCVGDRLSGHFVTGHVDQTAKIKNRQPQAEFLQLTIAGVLPGQLSLLVKKGSVSVNGVSLTVNELTDDGFSLMLIPETLARTNLEQLEEGDEVNLEFDMLAKMIQQQLVHWADPGVLEVGSKA